MTTEKVRQKLLVVGERMFWERGFNATGIQQIADQAEIPKGSFYNYFASKEAFAVAVIDYHWQAEWRQTQLDHLRDEIRDGQRVHALERLRNYFAADAKTRRDAGYRQGCLFGNFAAEMADHSEPIHFQVLDTFDKWCVVLDRCISDGQSAGEWRSDIPARILARFILEAWQGAIIRAKIDRSSDAFDEFMTLVFDQLLQ